MACNVGRILSVAGLIFGLCFHIRLYFNFVNPLTKLSEFSQNQLSKANNAENNEQTEKPQSLILKMEIDFFGSKNEDDLLFEDVSLQKSQSGEIAESLWNTPSSSKKKQSSTNEVIDADNSHSKQIQTEAGDNNYGGSKPLENLIPTRRFFRQRHGKRKHC